MGKEIKSNKGSVTLFVLLGCMLIFVVLVVIVMGNSNRKTNQDKELKKINNTYYQDENQIDQTYQSVINEQ